MTRPGTVAARWLVVGAALCLLVGCSSGEGHDTRSPGASLPTTTTGSPSPSPSPTVTARRSPAPTDATSPSPSPRPGDLHQMWVAVEDAGELVRVDLDTEEILTSVQTGDGPHNLTVSDEGTVAAALYAGGAAVAIVRDGQLRQVELGARPHDIKPIPDGFVVANEAGRRVELLAADGTPEARIDLRNEPHDLDVTPEGSRAWVTLNGTDELVLLDLAERKVVRYQPTGQQPHDIRVAPDGEIWITDWRGLLHVLSPQGALLDSLELGREAHHLAFTPDGNELWVVDHATQRAYVIDVASRRSVAEVALPGAPHHVAITPDGKLAAIADHTNGALIVVDVPSRERVTTIPVGPGPHGVWEVPTSP